MEHRRPAPRAAVLRRAGALALLVLVGGACASSGGQRTAGKGTTAGTSSTSAVASGGAGIYSAAVGPNLSPAVQGVPLRVYVPNSLGDSVDVIDPSTYKVVDHFAVGRAPQHVTPSWDLRTLYVDNTEGDSLTPIDPDGQARFAHPRHRSLQPLLRARRQPGHRGGRALR